MLFALNPKSVQDNYQLILPKHTDNGAALTLLSRSAGFSTALTIDTGIGEGERYWMTILYKLSCQLSIKVWSTLPISPL